MASTLKLSDLGFVGFACLTSETWRAAIECWTQFQRLLESETLRSSELKHKTLVRQSMDSSASGVVLRLQPRLQLSERDYEVLVEQWVGHWRSWLQGSGIAFEVTHCREIKLCGDALDTALDMASAEVHALLVEQCRRALAELDQGESLVAQVKREVAALAYQRVDSDRIAERLRISARTVRRTLAHRGTSFHDVVMEQRMTLAKRYLADPNVPIKQISSSLGYSDISSFHRAFRLQTGLTPGQFRGQSASPA